MWATTLWNPETLLLQWGVVIAAALGAAVVDLSSSRIPNRLTGPLLLGGLVWACCAGGLPGLADSLSACVLMAFPFVLLFLFAGGGAGDAKLMGAIGAWLGLVNGSIALVAVSLAGVVLALIFAVARSRVREALGNVAGVLRAFLVAIVSRGAFRDVRISLPPAREMQTVPYGVAIFAGVATAAGGVFLWSVQQV